MPKISLTTFIDFVAATGTSRITKVRNAKCRTDYHPNKDYWKEFRDKIVEFHSPANTDDKNIFFARFLRDHRDPKKHDKFETGVKNYKSLLGRKLIAGSPIGKSSWTYGDLQIIINPELFLTINGSKFVIKLYFKADALSRRKTDTILSLMAAASPRVHGADKYAIFDIPHKNIIEGTAAHPDHLVLARAEALAFTSLWNDIECP